MLQVIWVNFSGKRGDGLYESGASVIVGDLVSKNIPKAHSFTCNCGQCRYVQVDDSEIINNKVDHYTCLKDISLHNEYVDYETFTKDFYQEFFNAVREKYPTAFFSAGRNIAINTKEGELDVRALLTSMITKLTAKGYSFSRGNTKVTEREENFPLQIDSEDRNKFVTWIVAQNIPQEEMQRPRVKM